MSDKELIKQEIERLKHTSNAYDRSRFMLLLEIEKFIDSLPEESTNEANCIPKSDDLEEAAVEAFKKIVDSGNNSFLEIFKAGVEWQKDKMNLLLQTEYEKGLFDLNNALMKDAMDGCVSLIVKSDTSSRNLFISTSQLYKELQKYEAGDKLKIIIVKED